MAVGIAFKNGAAQLLNGAVILHPGATAAPRPTPAAANLGPPVKSWKFPVKNADGKPNPDATSGADLFANGTLRFVVASRGRVIHYAESPRYDLDARPPLRCQLTGKTLRIEFDLSRQPSPLPLGSEAK